MLNQDKLSIVVTAFEHWRSSRNGRQVPTPTELREQAVALLHYYSSSQVTSALRISGSQLKQWRHCALPTKIKPQFVHLPISDSPTLPCVKIELCFANGEQMHLSGVVNNDMLISLVGAMKS